MTSPADLEKWETLQARVHEAQICSAFEKFREAGIEPILIKGWAAAGNYPPDHLRRSGDIDLAVAPDDFPKAKGLMQVVEVSKLFIDLHEGLRLLDSLPWPELFDRSVLIDLNDAEIRVLCPEDHLRLLATHWLVDGGRFKDKLWDIYYAVTNRPPDFDWGRCLNVVEPNRRGWVICAIAIAHKYLGLPINELPFAADASSVPAWICRCIEREWERKDVLEPVLVAAEQDKRQLINQIARRLPPNPIRATIEGNGSLYGHRRFIYQLQVLRRRAIPFLRNSVKFVKTKLRSKNN